MPRAHLQPLPVTATTSAPVPLRAAAIARTRSRGSRFLRAWWPVLAAVALCPLVAALAPHSAGVPMAHARALAQFEQTTGTRFEPTLISLVAPHPLLVSSLDWIYTWVHLPAAIGALVWISLERRRWFAAFRNTFVLAQGMTAGIYLLWPTAPPWMLSVHRAPEVLPGSVAYRMQSPYAAMPSGHVVFAAIVAAALAGLTRPPILRLLGIGYQLFVIFLVLATGNHLWVDAAGGLLVTAVAAVLVRLGMSGPGFLR